MAETSPQDVAEDYVLHILLDQFDAAAAAVHDAELAMFQDQIVDAAGVLSAAALQRELLCAFDGAESLEDLGAFSPQEFLASFMSGVKRLTAGDREMEVDRVEVVGCEMTGDVATVEVRTFFRLEGLALTQSKISRVGLRRIDGRWRVLLDERIAGLRDRLVRSKRRWGPS